MIPLIFISSDHKQILQILSKQFHKATVQIMEPEKTEYSINQVRQMVAETKLLHNEIRIYFFPSFEKSSTETQNALLKILEEPPNNVQFVFSVENEYQLLPTILSRAKIIKTPGSTTSKKNKKRVLNKKLLSLINPDFTITNKEEAIKKIDDIINYFKEKPPYDISSVKILNESLKVRGLIINNNTNPQISLDHLLIFISKIYTMK